MSSDFPAWDVLDSQQGNLGYETAAILLLCFVFTLGFIICIAFTPKNVEEPQTLAAIFLWVPIVVAMVWLAVHASLELCHDVESRWLGVSKNAFWFLRIYVASNIVAIVLELLAWWSYDRSNRIPLSQRYPILAHHILSIVAYSYCLLYKRRMFFFACLDGCCEITTFFLGFLQMSKIKGGTFAQTFQKNFPKLLMLNGICLWLSFLIFRVVLFPTWLFIFSADVYKMPNRIWSQLSAFELMFYPAVNIFLLSLSSMWFVRLTKGVVKVLRSGGDVNKCEDTGLNKEGMMDTIQRVGKTD